MVPLVRSNSGLWMVTVLRRVTQRSVPWETTCWHLHVLVPILLRLHISLLLLLHDILHIVGRLQFTYLVVAYRTIPMFFFCLLRLSLKVTLPALFPFALYRI